MNYRRALLICIWVYCLSWSFDYRGEAQSGGTAVQFVFFAVTVASALGTIALGYRRLFALPVGWLTLGWGLYLLSTPLVAWVNGVDFIWFFKTSIPPFLLFTSLCVTQIAAASGLNWRHVLWPMLLASLINVIWKIVYALLIARIPIETVRLELLSPCLPFLMAYLFSGLALSRRVPWLPMIAGAVGTASYALSVTRSAVFILGAAGLGAMLSIWQARRLRLLSHRFLQIKCLHAMTAAGLLAMFGVLGVVAFPLVVDRWVERLFHTAGAAQSSADPSALTRYAETRSFYDLLNQEPLTWIYGKGLGAPYYWDERYTVELVEYTYGHEDEFRAETADVRFPGHSVWTYAVFSGGVLGGISYLLMFAAAVVVAFRAARGLVQVRTWPVELAFLPFITLLAFLSQSLTINPFIERAGGLVLGIVMGFPQFLYTAAWQARRAARAALRPAWSPVAGVPLIPEDPSQNPA